MKNLPILALVLCCLIAPAAVSQHIIEQATFPPGAASAPALAVSLDHYTAVAHLVTMAGDPEPQVAVQLVPNDPHTDELWPDLVVFGIGDRHQVCWSRDGFTLAFVREDTVWAYQSDPSGNWDLDQPQFFVPGGEIGGLDLWGAPTDAAGHAVFLCFDDDLDPSWEVDGRIHFASRSSYTGWSEVSSVLTDLTVRPSPQMSWQYGPAGPWPAIYFLANGEWELELYNTFRDEGVWTTPALIPGGTPTALEAELDVGRSASIGIVGLGPQPTCPCGTIHFLAHHDNGGWQPEVDLTAHYDYYDWPHSPRIDVGWNDVMHVFWFQLDSNDYLEPHHQRLEYRTYDDGVWTDAGDFLDSTPYRRGLGRRVDVGVTPDGERSVLAWSKTDTIAGEPQLEQVFVARSSVVSTAPATTVPQPATALTAWPNPFNPRVNLEVTLPSAGPLQLDVYDARGRHVQRVFAGSRSDGRHTFGWNGTLADGSRAPSGVYVARAVTGTGTVSRKLVLAE